MQAISEEHEMQVEQFLRFSNMKRDQHLKEVEVAVNDKKEYKLNEPMYTKEEVEDIIDSIGDEASMVVEKELANEAHACALLIRLLFQQAEQEGASLSVDMNMLENEMLLKQVKELEAVALSKPASAFLKKGGAKALGKMAGGASDPRVIMERDQLKQQVQELNDKFIKLQTQTTSVLKEKSQLQEEVHNLKKQSSSTGSELETATKQHQAELRSKEEEINMLRRNMQRLEAEKNEASSANGVAAAQATDAANAQVKALKREVQNAQEELRIAKRELEMSEKQVTDKLNESKQFLTMKKMMQTKSQQVQHLRKRLALYENPDEGIADGDA